MGFQQIYSDAAAASDVNRHCFPKQNKGRLVKTLIYELNAGQSRGLLGFILINKLRGVNYITSGVQ